MITIAIAVGAVLEFDTFLSRHDCRWFKAMYNCENSV
jgi:hypothetical protein